MTGWRKANSDIINHYELKLQRDQFHSFPHVKRTIKRYKNLAFLGLQYSHSRAIVRSKDQSCVYTEICCKFLSCCSTLRGDRDSTQQHFPVCSRKWMGIKRLPSPLLPPSPSAFRYITFLYSSFQTIFLSTSNSQECPQCLFWRAIHCSPQGYFPLSKPGSAIST